MSEIENWINEAAKNLDLKIKKLEKLEAASIVIALHQRFMDDDSRPWWHGLRLPFAHFDSKSTQLSAVVPEADTEVFFIPETHEEDLPVFRADLHTVESAIMDCPFFEYYIAGKHLDWLVLETEHDDFYVCSDRGSYIISVL